MATSLIEKIWNCAEAQLDGLTVMDIDNGDVLDIAVRKIVVDGVLDVFSPVSKAVLVDSIDLTAIAAGASALLWAEADDDDLFNIIEGKTISRVKDPDKAKKMSKILDCEIPVYTGTAKEEFSTGDRVYTLVGDKIFCLRIGISARRLWMPDE